MAFITEKQGARSRAFEYEKMACVAMCALAAMPFAFCAALTIWGS
jgi:hypothetical protein